MPRDPFIHDFGARIREMRLERELSQEKLAHLAGLHFSAVSHIERATRSSTLETVLKLAKALKVQPSELIPDIPASSFQKVRGRRR